MNRFSLAALAAVAAISGCGNDGSSNDGSNTFIVDPPTSPVPLETKEDVLREMDNLGGFTALFSFSESTTPQKNSRMKWDSNQAVPVRDHAKEEGAVCQEGGTFRVASDSATKRFEFLDLTRAVTISISRAEDCTDKISDNIVTIDNSVFESWVSQDDDGTTYLRGQRGRADDPDSRRFETRDASGAVVYFSMNTTYSVSETRLTDSVLVKYTHALSRNETSQSELLEYVVGGSNEPIIETYENNRYAVEGTYRYTSGHCAGGLVSVETLEGISRDRESFGFTGGSVRLTSGSAQATITINPDSSATIQFPDSRIEALSAEEMRRVSSSAPAC